MVGKSRRHPLAPELDVFDKGTARQLLLHDEGDSETWSPATSLATLLERGHPVLVDMDGHRLQIAGEPAAAGADLATRIAQKVASPAELPASIRALLGALGEKAVLAAPQWGEDETDALERACEAIVTGEHRFVFPDPR